MICPRTFTCGLLLLLSICFLSSSSLKASKNDYGEWGGIDEIDTSSETKLEEILYKEISLSGFSIFFLLFVAPYFVRPKKNSLCHDGLLKRLPRPLFQILKFIPIFKK